MPGPVRAFLVIFATACPRKSFAIDRIDGPRIHESAWRPQSELMKEACAKGLGEPFFPNKRVPMCVSSGIRAFCWMRSTIHPPVLARLNAQSGLGASTTTRS